MSGALLALERGIVELAARGDLGGDRFDGAIAQNGSSLGRIV